MRPLVALLLLALPALAAPVPKALKKETQPPDGRWTLVKVSSDGAEPAVPTNMALDWFVEGEIIYPGTKAELAKSGVKFGPNFTTPDPSKPKQRMWGKNPAVYEVDGDTLRACYASDGRKELTECKPGLGIAYYEFQRVKADK